MRFYQPHRSAKSSRRYAHDIGRASWEALNEWHQEVHADISALRWQTAALRANLGSFTGDLKLLQNQTDEVKGDVRELKREIVEVRQDVSELRGDMKGLTRSTESLHRCMLILVAAAVASAGWNIYRFGPTAPDPVRMAPAAGATAFDPDAARPAPNP